MLEMSTLFLLLCCDGQAGPQVREKIVVGSVILTSMGRARRSNQEILNWILEERRV